MSKSKHNYYILLIILIANRFSDETGKRKRYAMLDTLFHAESQGVIDHRGICDEVNTFMFEGYDTTATCLIFTLFNLAVHSDIQEKCYREVKNYGEHCM